MKEADCKLIVRQMFVDGLVIEELGIDHGNVIADIANLDGSVWYGYEIKTETDNLKRLPNQIRHYEMIFDYCYLFTHEKHFQEALEVLPKEWGVIVYSGDSISVSRESKKNKKVDKMKLADLMWKAELLTVLKDAQFKRISTLNSTNLRKLVVSKYDVDDIKLKVIEQMKTRLLWKPLKGDYDGN